MKNKLKLFIVLIVSISILSPIILAAWNVSDNSGSNPFQTNDVASGTGIVEATTSFSSPMIISVDGTETVNGDFDDLDDGNWFYISCRILYLDGDNAEDTIYPSKLYVNFPDHPTASQRGWAYASPLLDFNEGTRNYWFNLTDDFWEEEFKWVTTENGHTAGQNPSTGYTVEPGDEVHLAIKYNVYTDTRDVGTYFGEQGYPVGGDHDGISWAVYEWVEI